MSPLQTHGSTLFQKVVESILERRELFLGSAVNRGTPFYLYDSRCFCDELTAYHEHFGANVPRHIPYYAVKSNYHPFILREAVSQGFGLDVSSQRELDLALVHKPDRIIFSGPGKSPSDLARAFQHSDCTILQIDSFRELERLALLGLDARAPLRAGVRIFTADHGAWAKFGIPLAELRRFWGLGRETAGISLEGIQFHSSWNSGPRLYVEVLSKLADYLATEFPIQWLPEIRFIDFGGGFKPHAIEGTFTEAFWEEGAGRLPLRSGNQCPAYCVKESVPLRSYAEVIGAIVRERMEPLITCDYLSEPGRVLSAKSLHIVLQVVDKKGHDTVIVDGGINMVGWEKYLHTYVPIINLSRPSLQEFPVRVCGSLCDPEDIWGFFCYGDGIEEGDVLLLPNQGAYSHSVAQTFIRSIPEVFEVG